MFTISKTETLGTAPKRRAAALAGLALLALPLQADAGTPRHAPADVEELTRIEAVAPAEAALADGTELAMLCFYDWVWTPFGVMYEYVCY